MVSVKTHYDEIDIYKGIAILFIVLGHSFCSFPVDFSTTNLRYVQIFILSFHLNIFFVCSGILFSTKQPWKVFIQKKSFRLLLPWLFFSTLSIIARKIFSSYTHGHIENLIETILTNLLCGSFYWFLYALFLCMLITKAIKRKWILICLGVFSLILQYFTNDMLFDPNILCVSRIIHFYPWFLGGYLIKESYIKYRSYIINRPLLFNVYMLLALVNLIVLVTFKLFRDNYIHYYYMPLCGVFVFYIISIKILKNRRIKYFFRYFGQYSLQYYLNHLLIVLPCYYAGALVFKINHVFSLILIFSLSLLLSAIMLYVEKKNSLLRKLCGIV